jgi:hypothetical protein
MDNRLFILSNQSARNGVAEFSKIAPENCRVTFSLPKRGLSINAALHAHCEEVAKVCKWAGKKRKLEVWKRLFVAAWMRSNNEQIEILPALDGHGVDVVYYSTAEMSQEQVRDLLSFIEAWKAEQQEFVSE